MYRDSRGKILAIEKEKGLWLGQCLEVVKKGRDTRDQLAREYYLVKKTEILVILATVMVFVGYKSHDINEPYAYGHTMFIDADAFWHGVAHLDLGIRKTGLLNVWGVTEAKEPIFYLSYGPLVGIGDGLLMYVFGREFWTVRLQPFLGNLMFMMLLMVLTVRIHQKAAIPYLVVLFLACPYLVKYGTSHVGYFATSMTFGLIGYVSYFRFGESGNHRWLYTTFIAFAIGLGFSWQPGFMALPVFVHIAMARRPVVWRVRTLVIFSGIMLASVAAILIHQGLITGDYFHPFSRLVARSKSTVGARSIGWLDLAAVQGNRFWELYGPVLSILSGFWFLRWLVSPRQWSGKSTWIVALAGAGLFLGFFLKNSAFIHDFTLLAMSPGVFLAGAAGAVELQRLARDSRFGRMGLRFAVPALLLLHVAIGVRSAQSFEEKEAADLDNGLARVAFFLRDRVPESAILIADATSGYSKQLPDGREVGLLMPSYSYLARRPVWYAGSIEALKAIMGTARDRGVGAVLVHVDRRQAAGVDPPSDWVSETHRFGTARILFLKTEEPVDLPAPSAASGLQR